MESGEIVFATNKSTHAVTLTYESRDLALQPDVSRAIPFDAMVCYFGDPRSKENIYSMKDSFGIITWIPDRATEVRRLRVKWGAEGGDSRYVNSPNRAAIVPPVEFTTQDGEPIVTVVDDPLGDRINEVPWTKSEVEMLREQVVRQQSQLDQLAAALRPSPVDDEIALSVPEEEARQSLVEQAHEAFQATDDAPADPLANLPEDASTASYTGSQAAQATMDLTGNPIRLSDKAAELARIREEAAQ